MVLKFFLKEGEKILLYLFAILIIVSSFVIAETPTELDIPNSPPYLLMPIPNQSWLENESNLNAFDLDDYFADAEGDPLSYYNSSLSEIYVSIDPVTHEVSFYPLTGFHGTRNVTFYASDSIYDTLSNEVVLYVGMDFSPPNWSSPVISKSVVYQYDIISFFTNWTDDRALAGYIFSINQGAGWENYSAVNFSGTENVSSRAIQILAPALNTVYWRFYAFDASSNFNVTSTQSFSVSGQQAPGGETGENPEEPPSGGTRTIESILGRLELQRRKSEGFQLSTSEFKVSIKQGETKTRVLRITNTGLDDLNISISSEKISGFVVFSENNFSIAPGKSKEVTIDFSASERVIPGQYFGYIDVRSKSTNKSLPVVLDIQAINIDFGLKLNLSEGYELVRPGKNVKFNITITNLKDLKQINASLYYAIKDYEGIVYNFSEEDITFFYGLNLERELQVPGVAEEGKYLVYARVSDDNNVAIDSVAFEVGNRFNFSSFFKISSISFLIILLGILFAIFMVKYKRDKKKERLLELYIMLNRLKNLIKQGNQEEAFKLFVKLKSSYHEPVSREIFNDKEKLKKEIAELYAAFAKESKQVVPPSPVTNKPPVKNPAPETTKTAVKSPPLSQEASKQQTPEDKKRLKDTLTKDKGKNDQK